MKRLATLSILLSLVFLLQSLFAHAERLDAATDSLVIEKLEAALPGLKGEKSEPGVLMRLADLYAERARLKAIDEEAANCCGDAKKDTARQDRMTAIEYYSQAYSR